jgi:hypothetical protein
LRLLAVESLIGFAMPLPGPLPALVLTGHAGRHA